MTDGCSGFGCQTECLGAADLFWPQAVGTAVLTVAMAGSGDPKVRSKYRTQEVTKVIHYAPDFVHPRRAPLGKTEQVLLGDLEQRKLVEPTKASLF